MEDSEQNISNAIRSSLLTETVFLAVASSIAYLFAYRVEESYLAYFGVENSFVSLGLSQLAFAASGLIAFLLWIYWMTNWLVPLLRPWMAQILASNIHTLGVLAFFVAAYVSSGVTWFSVILLVVIVLFVVVEVGLIVRRLSKGGTVFDYWSESSTSQFEASARSLDGLISSKIGNSNWFLIFVLLFGLPILGDLVGWYQAKSQKTFLLVQVERQDFLVVRAFQNGMVISSIEGVGGKQSWPKISGRIRWLSETDLNSTQFIRRVFFGGIRSIVDGPKRQSFDDWYQANWGNMMPDDGRAGR